MLIILENTNYIRKVDMISFKTIEGAMCEAMCRAATFVPPDVGEALERCRDTETEPLAQSHLDVTQENFRLSAAGAGLVCADTGFPLFFIRAGSNTQIEDGFQTLWRAARSATARATENAFLRPTMVDPLSRDNPGDNVGPGMPKVELAFVGDGHGLQIVAAPKGGGSEIFGTFYRMLFPSDGQAGIYKFVIESILDACYAGKICPPAIVGVGIGGTADLCMKMAKEAAVLRPIGSKHDDEKIASMEAELLDATRELRIGPMGARGACSVMALHIETAVTHTAALPVAVNAQCLIGRRWQANIDANGNVELTGEIR